MARWDFLAYFFLSFCIVSGQLPRYVLKGQKVTLKKDITGQPDNILWTHNGNKVVEFNGREERVYDPYKTRVALDWSSAELHIIDLRLEDSGKYELEVFVNHKLDKSYHDVEILDSVAKPTISCKINNSNNSGTLVCSAEPRQPVHLMKFEWHSQGNVHPGPHLQIYLGDELDEQVYSCMVSNPLTTETAAFTAKDCYTTKSSSVALIAVVIIISLLLIAGAGIFYCHRKQKGCFAHDPKQGDESPDRSKEQHQRPVPAPRKKKEFKSVSGDTVEYREVKPLLPKTQDISPSKHYNNNKHQPSDGSSAQILSDVQQLSRSADKEKQHGAGDPELNDESADSSEDVGSDVYSPTDIPPGLVKRRSKKFQPIINPIIEKHMAKQHQRPIPAPQERELKRASDNYKHQHSDDSSVQNDSDVQQHNEPAEKQQSTGDPKPSGESADSSEDQSSECESSTASDHSGL